MATRWAPWALETLPWPQGQGPHTHATALPRPPLTPDARSPRPATSGTPPAMGSTPHTEPLET